MLPFVALKSELPKWKIVLNWVCGVEMEDDINNKEIKIEPEPVVTSQKSAEELAEECAGLLYEPEWKRTMVDANAVLVMAVAMFFWGFYA